MKPTMSMPQIKGLPKATSQQLAIACCQITPGESIKVDAGAGTGKTSTLLHYAQNHKNEKILYICFNTKATQEAAAQFTACGLHHVTCSTIHGLAKNTKALYSAKGKFQNRIHLREIRIELDCTQQFAWKVQHTLNRFFHSSDDKPNESHTTSSPKQGKEINPVENSREVLSAIRTGLVRATTRIWNKMQDLQDPFPISFDAYLKVFQLQRNKLPYDTILLDESQDSNPAALQILADQRENTRIILVGDQFQSLYAFRSAVNAMKHWQSKRTYPLNESFRFGPKIAQAANLILQNFLDPNKKIIGLKPTDSIGKIPENVPHTFISRTNAKLIEAALAQIHKGNKIHFCGTTEDKNFDPTIPYKFNDMLDAWRLFSKEKGKIINPYFQNFDSYEELVLLAKGQTAGENPEGITIQGDKELEALVRMIEKHKTNLPNVLEKIKENCTSIDEAHLVLSTTHRAKGLEFPYVKMADDFTNIIVQDPEEDPETKSIKDGPPRAAVPGEDADPEEFNILYVAITRAEKRLELCPQILKALNHPHLLRNPETAHLQIDPQEEFFKEWKNSPEANKPSPTHLNGSQPNTQPPEELKIPFEEKDIAKEIAQAEGGRLLWNPTRKTWRWSHKNFNSLPVPLKQYLKKSRN